MVKMVQPRLWAAAQIRESTADPAIARAMDSRGGCPYVSCAC